MAQNTSILVCLKMPLVPAGTDYGQYIQEDVDDVQIQCECTENVLLWAD